MLKRTLFATVAGMLLSLVSATLPAHAQDRLPQVIPASSARVSVANTVNRKVKLATDLGAANPNQALELSIRFNMTPAQTLALQQLLANQQNPSSPQYHQWLTPQQFGAQFGLSAADLAAVTNWLQSQGFSVTGVANGRTFITFSGTVAQAEKAFNTSIHSLKWNGEQHFSNVNDPALPAAIGQVTAAITGLNDFRVLPRVHRRSVAAGADTVSPKFDAGGSEHFLAPADFYAIYDENALLAPSSGTAINGTGVTIGVLGQVDVYTSDLSAFRTAAGLSTANLPTQVSEGNTPSAPSASVCTSSSPPSSCDDLYESSIDLEWSGASAPNANILFITGQDIFANAMTEAIDKDLAPILTISYGECEQYFNTGTPTTQTLDQLFMQANAQGQTILGPGGDTGAVDCDSNQGESLATMGLAVDYPASSPYVTGVGGTQFNDAAGTYWNSGNSTTGGSAIGYIPEQPWNEFYQVISGTTTVAGLNNGAGGGGVSSSYSKPYWQQGPGVPADASRDVPDVSYAAAAVHDPYLFCALGSCTNGGFSYTSSGQTYFEVGGGTSFATPIFAGTLALVEQKTAGKIGNANPIIYGLANSTYLDTVFHNKTSGGNNTAPCSAGTIDCSAGFPNYYAAGTLACPSNSCSGTIDFPAIGYLAGSGYVYDPATGWGSVDVSNFVNDWSLATPISAPSASTDNASVVNVTTSTPSISAGGQIAISVSVASGVSSATSTPTGTVTLVVDGVEPSPGVTASLSGGAATLTYTTPATIASGTHTISISYSGDSVYAGSKGATSVDVTSTSAQDFSLTPTAASVSVPLGGTSSPITYTVTSLNGFSGQVTFSAANAALENAAYTFSVDPVTVTAATPGTTAITVYAYYNSSTGLFRSGNLKRLGSSGTARKLSPVTPWVLGGSGAALAGLLLFGFPAKRRNRWSALLIALFTIAVLSGAGCTGASGPANENNGNINAPAGTYPISIIATGTNSTGGTISHTVTLNFTIQ